MDGVVGLSLQGEFPLVLLFRGRQHPGEHGGRHAQQTPRRVETFPFHDQHNIRKSILLHERDRIFLLALGTQLLEVPAAGDGRQLVIALSEGQRGPQDAFSSGHGCAYTTHIVPVAERGKRL